MHQKETIRAAWAAAGLYDDPDPELRLFLRLFDDPAQCWTELTLLCRHSFAPYKSRIVQPILDCDDPLVRLLMIRTLRDTGDEAVLLEHYIETCDPDHHRAELRAIAHKNNPDMNRSIRRKRDLPGDVRAALAQQDQALPHAPAVLGSG
jgi:hypothetical protein